MKFFDEAKIEVLAGDGGSATFAAVSTTEPESPR
jgi:GTPase involved in cell partitioning and DNA repair